MNSLTYLNSSITLSAYSLVFFSSTSNSSAAILFCLAANSFFTLRQSTTTRPKGVRKAEGAEGGLGEGVIEMRENLSNTWECRSTSIPHHVTYHNTIQYNTIQHNSAQHNTTTQSIPRLMLEGMELQIRSASRLCFVALAHRSGRSRPLDSAYP